MALVIPPGFAQMAYRWQLAGDPEPMICTVGANVGAFAGASQDAVDAWAEAFAANWPAASQGNQWTYIGVVGRFGQDGGPPTVFEAPRNRVGTLNLTGMPSNCAYLVRKLTNRGGRTGRGRMYLPPFAMADDDVNQLGVVLAGTAAAITGLVNDWFDGLAAVLLHDSAAPGGDEPTVINNFVCEGRIATQRRRLRP